MMNADKLAVTPNESKPTARTRAMRQRQTMRALTAVRELLLSGHFKPRQRLSELALVELTGVSRSCVRIALAVLEQQGLVDARPRGGYVPREFGQQDIHDMLELRAALMGAAAGLAASRAQQASELIARLRASSQAFAELKVDARAPETVARLIELGYELHQVVGRLASSGVLRRIARAGMTLPLVPLGGDALWRAIASDPPLLEATQRRCRSLADAIERGDVAGAEQVAREEAHATSQVLERLLADQAVDERTSLAALAQVLETRTAAHKRAREGS